MNPFVNKPSIDKACWPVYLFGDTLELIKIFNNYFYQGEFTDLSDVIDKLE